MLSDASSGHLPVAWWIMLFPGLFLVLTTLAFNLLGDGLRDALDPRGRRGELRDRAREEGRRLGSGSVAQTQWTHHLRVRKREEA